MLRTYRRCWIVPTALLLALPLAFYIVAPYSKTVSPDELRDLAPPPTLPNTLRGWLKLPGQMDAYLRDHFGLRRPLLRAYALLGQNLLQSGNALVLLGRNGWMFYRGDQMVLQSAGLVRRDELVASTADLLLTMNKALAVRGIRLLVASPPNSATIYQDELPRWAQNWGQRTEYDLLLDALAARGILAVDLRPALHAARAEGKVYHMHDTHWTMRGALAGFNAIVQAASHPDWRLDAASVLGPPITMVGGDLARMLGTATDVTELNQDLTLPPGKRELFSPDPFATYTVKADRPGPTIMIIGDSFTMGQFAPMLLQHAGGMAWLHHRSCGFDWKWIEQFRPDEVWWMPTERSLVCSPGTAPNGFPSRVAQK
jgi:hypothetical protein